MEVPEIRPVVSEDAAGVWRLLLLADWAEPEETLPDWVAGLIAGSIVIVGAFERGGRLVGLARALSDGVSDAFVQDVVVDPAWRGRGVGAALVIAVVAALEERGVDWIGLVATPGNAEFYRRLGFETLEQYTPMRWTRRLK